MSAIAKPLLVILSVALNSAFVVTWLSHTLPGGKCPDHKEDDCPLFRKIGVTEDQVKQIGPRLKEFRERAGEQCHTISRLRRELIDLIAEPDPNRQAIVAKQKEILDGQQKMQELVVEQLLAGKSVLNADQQKAFFELLRTHCGCDGAGKALGLLGPAREIREERPPEAAGDCPAQVQTPKRSS
jgi:Spy/CpxP family protein refolding chaperone